MALNFLRSFRSDSGPALGGRYSILKQLGAGGFGQTFLAQDLHLPGQPQCVIKQLKPHDRGAQQLQVARRLFDTEARALYELGNHPQIPRLLAHFEENGEFYLAQELIDGHSLTEEFNGLSWDAAHVVAFLGDVLGTLTFVHDHRVIHRDLKPSNLIRRDRDSRIVTIDFGAVKQVGTQLVNLEPGTANTVAVGTQGYMPSEQLSGQPRFSSDIYAVGIMGIQALTGQQTEQLTHNSSTGEIDWHRYAPGAPAGLVSVLDVMVRYDFRTRYPTAREAIAALQSLPAALSQHLPAALSESSASGDPARDNASSPQPAPPPPQPDPDQQTVAVVGRPRASESFSRGHTEIAAASPLRPNRRPSGRLLPTLMAIAAVFGAGAFAWRACAPPPISPTATQANPADELTPAVAQATVTEFYDQVSSQSWAEARSLTAGVLAAQFDPGFFQNFQRVAVENLQVREQDADALTLVGENIYTYSDGSRQREARTFTVQLVEGEPRIVGSEFVRVIQARS